MSPSAPSLLSSLLDLITVSTRNLQAELAAADLPEPWLDSPALHPWDEHTPSRAYWDSRRSLLDALAMMTAIVQNPRENILVRGMGYHHPAALNFTVRSRISDILAANDVKESTGLPIEEIARRAGTHPMKTTAVLRLLATYHIFKETSPGVFANNRLSHLLKAADPTARVPIFWGEVAFHAAAMLSRTLRDPATASSFDVADAAFARAFAHGFEGLEFASCLGSGTENHSVTTTVPTTFAFLASPRYATYRASFDAGMRTLDLVHGPDGLRDFPWERWDIAGAVFVDVGASTGHLARTLLPALAHATFVCQDRPEACALGEAFFGEHCPRALSQRVVFQSHDFFSKQPVVGAALYILSNILHDWPEPEGLVILQHIGAAMAPTSRLLVIEAVIVPGGGAADAYKAHQSVEMLSLFNARDRTQEEYAALFGRAGMDLERVWPLRRVGSIMEIRRKGT